MCTSRSTISYYTAYIDEFRCVNVDHWNALSRLIDLMRRAGQLESAEEFLKKAETQNHNAPMIAGYNYCKGLHLWFVTILAK